MNFLAHIYLSGTDPLLQIGNFMADGVKGNKWEAYSGSLQAGILMHRFIDTFTDSHPIFRQTTKLLHPQLHHYAGIGADMIYDHFLAKNFARYHAQPLAEFAEDFYQNLSTNSHLLPESIQRFTPIMIQHNWLVAYAEIATWDQIMQQMARRRKHAEVLLHTRTVLEANYQVMEAQFTAFFEALQSAIENEPALWNPKNRT